MKKIIDWLFKQYRCRIVFFSLIVFVMLFSTVYFFCMPDKVRRTFVFPMNNGGLVTEIRYLADGKDKETRIESYVRELVLGPRNHKGMSLLTPGTKINNIFVREDVLYMDFAESALLPGMNTVDNLLGLPLIEKNVFTNFKNIDTIILYINGNIVYEDWDILTEKSVDSFLKEQGY